MKKLLLILFTLSTFVHADIIDDYKQNKKVVVVFGENAPEAEKKAAQEIFKILELGSTGDLYDHIITDTYALKHQFFYSSFHLIIVGTPESNMLCRTNSEIQMASPAKNNSPIKILPNLNKNKDALFSSLYGYYPQTKGIGYVRRMLNPFTLQTFNLTKGTMNASPYVATFISGTDADGITAAYINFLDMKMMEGVVIPENLLAEKNSRFRLAKKNQNEIPLEKVDKTFKLRLGQEFLEYKGWIRGTVGDYAGMKKLSGVSADQIFHLKFASATPQLMTYDDQVNTVLMLNFESPEASLKALKGIDSSMKLALQISDSPDLKIYPCGGGGNKWFLVRQGSFLFIENFSEQWKEPFAKQASGLLKN
ncbi:MAG: hypothetical protein NE328_23485 [Lentisphaeraceae bacterium]|nr:hypothetical protein [Lentisphaeraceae bacterium]